MAISAIKAIQPNIRLTGKPARAHNDMRAVGVVFAEILLSKNNAKGR
jgi:hypothetical protein